MFLMYKLIKLNDLKDLHILWKSTENNFSMIKFSLQLMILRLSWQNAFSSDAEKNIFSNSLADLLLIKVFLMIMLSEE